MSPNLCISRTPLLLVRVRKTNDTNSNYRSLCVIAPFQTINESCGCSDNVLQRTTKTYTGDIVADSNVKVRTMKQFSYSFSTDVIRLAAKVGWRIGDGRFAKLLVRNFPSNIGSRECATIDTEVVSYI